MSLLNNDSTQQSANSTFEYSSKMTSMKAISLKLHNFRTFSDTEISLSGYSLFVGANNTGKSNLIDAIRIFYEKDIKYDENRDFPKFVTADKESWIELQFKPSAQEFASLKQEYQSADGTFRVRKYLQSSELDDDNKPKSNIYAYVGGQISNSRFYGAKNIQQGKFGDLIYIPAVSRLDDHTKLTGPSALRDLINSVLKKIMDSSSAYGELKSAFNEFGGKLKNEVTGEGHSLMGIETEISQDIQDWGTSFELFINPVTPDDLVKTLVGHRVHDKALGQTQDPKSYGQGFQRHLIFTLIKLSARYMTPPRTSTGREFSPQLTWLLFEEPEAFLHPSQIDALDTSLRKIAQDENWQVSITTHSPEFVSKNVEDLSSLAKLCRQGAKTNVGQISSTTLASILSANQSDLPTWAESGIPVHADDLRLDMESVKYSLWLDPRRCSAFFANKVLLVEGPTECALIGYLLGIGQLTSPVGGVFILDTIGKFNIHRFMNLFGELGIPHAVLYDHDNGKYAEVDKTIQSAKNSYTLGVDSFPQDLETFLGIPSAGPSHRKPQHAMLLLGKGEIDSSKLSSLINKIATLLGI